MIQTVGLSALGVGVLSGTAAAQGANVAIKAQTATVDPKDGDDFPVPDAYIVELPRVKFEADEGTIALPVKKNQQGTPVPWFKAKNNAPAFVVGLHSPEVGTGEPDSLSSLIGVRPFTPGKYNNVKIPVWAGPTPWQSDEKGKVTDIEKDDFPTDEEVEVTATLWYGPDRFPPDVPRENAKITTPKPETIGPISRENGELVSNTAEVRFPELEEPEDDEDEEEPERDDEDEGEEEEDRDDGGGDVDVGEGNGVT
ncbi:MAG: hypothetical protein ABEI27_12625 [Halobellus sp.]|uniref:hypothetical protein n=1 Tax=Halobellus sp. TaxID=1979212 RepID=UPI0035D451A6